MIPRPASPSAVPVDIVETSSASASASPAAPLTRRELAVEIVLRACAAAVLLAYVTSAINQLMKDPSRITLMLFAFTAVLDIGLVVATRPTRTRDWNPLSVTMTLVGSFYYLAFRLEPGTHLISETAAAALQLVGLAVQMGAKFTLRRSFGLLPANRGVVVRGPYRLVRHPIYFGYTIRDLGFLLPNFGMQNLFVLVVHLSVQVCRIVREERVLSKDPSYREYIGRVKYRLIPGVF